MINTDTYQRKIMKFSFTCVFPKKFSRIISYIHLKFLLKNEMTIQLIAVLAVINWFSNCLLWHQHQNLSIFSKNYLEGQITQEFKTYHMSLINYKMSEVHSSRLLLCLCRVSPACEQELENNEFSHCSSEGRWRWNICLTADGEEKEKKTRRNN